MMMMMIMMMMIVDDDDSDDHEISSGYISIIHKLYPSFYSYLHLRTMLEFISIVTEDIRHIIICYLA